MSSNTSMTFQLPSNRVTTMDILNKVAFYLSLVTIVLGVAGNSLVIWMAGFKLKAKVTNVWLVNLAVADLTFSLSQIFSLNIFLKRHWPFGLFLCQFNGFFKYANMFCSVFLLAVISLDRVLCVWQPVFMKRRRTLLAARVVAVCVWVASILLGSPYFIYRNVYVKRNNLTSCIFDLKHVRPKAVLALNLNRLVCGFILPFIVILVCYILAGVGIRRTRLVGKSRPLRILASLVIAFFLCWAPYHGLLLARTLNSRNKVVKTWYPLASGIAHFNSCVNPLLYFCMGLKRALAEDLNAQSIQLNERSLDESSGSKQITAAEVKRGHFDAATAVAKV